MIEVMEVEPAHGRTVVTALAGLGGAPVAVVANQPAVKAGAIDAEGADKAAHFLGVAGAFHLPVVFLADNPGVLADLARKIAQAGVNLDLVYIATRNRVVFGSPDIDALRVALSS